MSLVDSWPSTVTRSNERCTHTPSSSSAVSGASPASVCTKQSIVAKRGEIMPAPLHWAHSRTLPDGSATSRLARFSNGRSSGSRAGSPRRRRGAAASAPAGSPSATASTGRKWLIPPVEASATSRRSRPRRRPRRPASWRRRRGRASRSPRWRSPSWRAPPAARPGGSARALSRTGAAARARVVKRAALTRLLGVAHEQAEVGLAARLQPRRPRRPRGSPPAARRRARSSRTWPGRRPPSARRRTVAAAHSSPSSPAGRTSGSGSAPPARRCPSRGCRSPRTPAPCRCARRRREHAGSSWSRARRARPGGASTSSTNGSSA